MPGPVFAEGETVSLHPIEEEDLEFVQRGRNHPDIRRPLTDVDPQNGEQIQEYFENGISGDGDGDGFGFLICVDERGESTEEASGVSVSGANGGSEERSPSGETASSVGERSEPPKQASGEAPDDDEDGDDDDGLTRVGAVHVPWVRTKHGSGMLMYWVAPEHQGNGYVTEATELILDFAFEERRLAKVYAVVLESNVASQRVLENLGFEREGVHRKETFVDGERRDNYRYGLLADEWLSGRSDD